MAEPQIKDVSSPLDLSHHFSRTTKNRNLSSVKNFYKYFNIPGIGNLAGGLPNASYFPYDTLEASTALPNRFKVRSDGALDQRRKAKVPSSDRILVPHVAHTSNSIQKIDLTTALQYGTAQGYPPLLTFLRQFTRDNLHPNVPYKSGPEIVLDCGSTDGFSKFLEAFTEPWDKVHDDIEERQGIIVEEFAYMSAVQSSASRGTQVVPVSVDGQGLNPSGPDGLEAVLKNWDPRKGKRPHVMYTVTIGHNPTGGTLSVERRKDIYRLCQKYDIIICEDDPYWFLQYSSAESRSSQDSNSTLNYNAGQQSSGYPFLDSLVPSYLSVDTDGRVVRLDTFSKTMAPGCRLGWITAQPAIIERILRITESSTQQPSGFVQAMVAEMIIGPSSSEDGGRGGGKDGKGWSMDGWVRWLEGLRGVYERRMNIMCQILDEGKDTITVSTVAKCRCRHHNNTWEVVRKRPIFTFEWPHGGMFIWIKVDFCSHPLHGQVPYPKLAKALWVFLTTPAYLVLVAPGHIFSSTREIQEKKGWQYFRVCFAAVDDDQVESMARRFVKGVQDFWAKTEIDDPDDDDDDETLTDIDETRQMFQGMGC